MASCLNGTCVYAEQFVNNCDAASGDPITETVQCVDNSPRYGTPIIQYYELTWDNTDGWPETPNTKIHFSHLPPPRTDELQLRTLSLPGTAELQLGP